MKKSSLLILVIAITLSLMSCKAKIPTNEHILMLSISSSRSLIEHSEDDYFVGSSWIIYYDGQVEFENKYNISGTADEQSWTLDVEQLTNLYEILDGDFKKNGVSELCQYSQYCNMDLCIL